MQGRHRGPGQESDSQGRNGHHPGSSCWRGSAMPGSATRCSRWARRSCGNCWSSSLMTPRVADHRCPVRRRRCDRVGGEEFVEMRFDLGSDHRLARNCHWPGTLEPARRTVGLRGSGEGNVLCKREHGRRLLQWRGVGPTPVRPWVHQSWAWNRPGHRTHRDPDCPVGGISPSHGRLPGYLGPRRRPRCCQR